MPAPTPTSPIGWLARCRRALFEFRCGLLGRPSERDPLGPEGERIARRHLRRLGYRTLGRNLRVRTGEADLLMLAPPPDRSTIVLVEVKTRRVRERAEPGCRLDAPPPEASVDAAKKRKLREVLSGLVAANGWHDRPMRIDIVAVEIHAGRPPVVRHLVNAVERAG